MPVIVPHHHPPSARARALGGMLGDTIREYQKANGEMNSIEIQQALQVALAKAMEGRSANVAPILAIMVAVAMAGGILAYTLGQQRGGDPASVMPYVLTFMAVIAAVVIVVRLRRG